MRLVYLIFVFSILYSCSGGDQGLKKKVLDGTASAEEVQEFADQAANESVQVYSQSSETATTDCETPQDANENLVAYHLGNCQFAFIDQSVYQHSHYNQNQPSVFTMPKTGQILVTLRENSANWQSSLYLQPDSATIELIEDSRVGPLNVTSEHAFLKGTNIHFYLMTQTPAGPYIHLADSSQARIEYNDESKTYTIGFEDIPEGVEGLPTPDYDFNDVVIDVQIVNNEFLDMSGFIDISIDYLNPHGFNAQGYAIYYIGERMQYNINVAIDPQANFGNQQHTIYALQEYYEDITSDRFWYPSYLRPPGEPQTISVKKGDLLANQNPPASFTGLTFSSGQSFSLPGSYTSDLSIAAGNDQTHVIIVRENEDGQIETTIYDNAEAGVFDPPPAF